VTSNWPTVTVIVTTYKRPHLLPRALDSVARQTFTDFELIVVHDGPPDPGTIEVCSLYNNRFEQLGIDMQLVATEEPSGYYTLPSNLGTFLARGDYIAYLDDDNAWTADHLELLVNAIEEGDVWPDFTYGRREYVHDPSLAEEHRAKLPQGPSPLVPWDETARQRLAAGPMHNFIDRSDFLVSKGALWMLYVATGQIWNENARRFGDWDLVTRGAHFAGWRGKAVDAVVQYYHWHGDQVQLTRPPSEVPRAVYVN
jgi:glycosyltransferase involved in cell wall biosynthesis